MGRQRLNKEQGKHPHLDKIINLGDLPPELAQQVWGLVQEHCPQSVDPESLGALGGIKNLPEDLVKQIDAMLSEGRARSYGQLTDYINSRLAAMGIPKRLPVATLSLYGRQLKAEQQALRDAQQLSMAIAQAVPEDDGTLASATLMVAKSNLFQIAKNLDPERIEIKSMSDYAKFARAMLDVMKATSDHSANMETIRLRVAQASEEVCQIAKTAGADDQVIAEISSKLLGIPLEAG